MLSLYYKTMKIQAAYGNIDSSSRLVLRINATFCPIVQWYEKRHESHLSAITWLPRPFTLPAHVVRHSYEFISLCIIFIDWLPCECALSSQLLVSHLPVRPALFFCSFLSTCTAVPHKSHSFGSKLQRNGMKSTEFLEWTGLVDFVSKQRRPVKFQEISVQGLGLLTMQPWAPTPLKPFILSTIRAGAQLPQAHLRLRRLNFRSKFDTDHPQQVLGCFVRS